MNEINTKDKMKYATLLSLIIVAFLTGFALKTLMIKKKIDTMQEMKKTNRQLDEERIRKTEAAYDHAWQQGDIEGIIVCFTNDAVLISPRGDVAIGSEQIHNLLSDFLGSEAKSTKHTSHITRISFVTDDVAVVDGEAFIEGSENLSATVKQHRFTDILVRSGDVWLIAQIRAYAIN
ncbi:MAG: SgcJ/EcaC family oxidoreductase [Bacteroidales bacterium]|nr:SgcJ/EcaC family oxidoreductase [Bacteroidales bacterium]